MRIRKIPFSLSNGPITIQEFCDAFKKALPIANGLLLRRPLQRPPRFGLAVSGGVDSMALASLCRSLREEHRLAPDTFQAFVVDHKARSASRLEALATVTRLEAMGTPAQVLTLKWPPGEDPAALSNFESQARKLRYHALGLACRHHGIDSLLLAHHEDDQAESILMRLACGQVGSGLQGIQSSVEIPECYGIIGVHRSSFASYHSIKGHNDLPLNSQVKPNKFRYVQDKAILELERHGIKLYRPLLSFSKQRLVATCKLFGISWEEDPTNKDPALGPRNVARSLLQSGRLPKALRKDSLLAIAEKQTALVAGRTSVAEEFFAKCQIVMLDLRSGAIVVRLPRSHFDDSNIAWEYLGIKIDRQKRIIARLLRRIIDLVSPSDKTPLRKAGLVVDKIFPEIGNPEYNELDRPLMDSPITTAEVSFRRMLSPLLPEDAGKVSELDPDYTWTITRQVPNRAFRKSYSASIPPAESLLMPPNTDDQHPNDYPHRPGWSPWHLFDGRYWIRVYNGTRQPMTIRFLDSQDMESLRTRSIDTLLKEVAPGTIRWTLPALLGGDGRVWALPSLGVRNPRTKGVCEWEIRYKKIDIGSHDPSVIHR